MSIEEVEATIVEMRQKAAEFLRTHSNSPRGGNRTLAHMMSGVEKILSEMVTEVTNQRGPNLPRRASGSAPQNDPGIELKGVSTHA